MLFSTKVSALFLLFVLVSGCKNDEDEPSTEDNTKDRQEILIHWADNIIKPSYANFQSTMDAMTGKAEAFITGPSESTLGELRSSWINAYTEWQKVELYEFGPADKYTLRNFFNIYPANTSLINSNIDDPSASLDVPSAYASQGFPALDYLINGLGQTDSEIVASYTTDAKGANRIAYLQKLISRMNTLLGNVISEWNGSYRDTFVSKTGLDIGSSMGSVVNAYVLEYERYIRSGKIGIPAGVFSSQVIQPDKVEAFYKKDLSKTLAQTALNASLDFFNGKAVSGSTGPSLKSYLDALDAKDSATGTLLSTVITNQFAEANTMLDALSPNFSEQVQSDNAAMLSAYASLQKLVRLFKLDMTSAMSITITYTDNDGD